MKALLLPPNKYSHRLPPLAFLFHTFTLSYSSSSSSKSYNKCRKYGVSSSSLSVSQLYQYSHYRLFSSSSDKYKDFFPCSYNESLSDLIDCRHSQPLYDIVDEVHYTFTHDHANDTEPVFISKDHPFDVISLLSTYSDHLVRIGPNINNNTDFVKANTLRGKYILLFCAFLPCPWLTWESIYWRKFSLLYSELSQTHQGSNFEMVIVHKMRKGWENDEGVFHHSLSAFSGCLTVPFSHKYRCDFILKSLNFDGKLKCILVDHSQKVLIDFYEFIVQYGARGFPFTHDHDRFLIRQDCWCEPYHPSNKTLAGLLSCESDPSSFLLRKLDSEETISVEQLNKSLVGLYLFQEGTILNSVNNVYQQCRNQGLDFEIVLVCLPFRHSIHPQNFQDIALCAMKKQGISDWWVFPFNNSAFLRLDHLSNSLHNESMIIVGPHNNFVDSTGGQLVFFYGHHFGTQMYPFTMEALLQVFLQRLEIITLETFFPYDYVYRDYECDDSKRMPVAELKGKNVLVYIAYAECLRLPPWGYETLGVVRWYDVIKEQDSNFEVVFVPVMDPLPPSEYPKRSSDVRECILKSKTKWLICPFDDPKLSQFIRNNDAFIFSGESDIPEKGLPESSLLAFGEDGHLHSLDALRLLRKHGLDAYPFHLQSKNLNLRKDITRCLYDEYHLMDDVNWSVF